MNYITLYNTSSDIIVDEDTMIVDQVSHISYHKNIVIWPNACMIYCLIGDDSNITITIHHTWDKSSSIIRTACIWRAWVQDQYILTSILDHAHTSTDITMVTFLKSGAHSIVEGMIRISPDCIWASGYLHEKNIILGNNISIKTLPQLDIHHHNVKAGHGATIDSINDRSLFYMMSKGITKKDATKLILNGVIETLFEWYPQDHTISELKQNLLDTVVAD